MAYRKKLEINETFHEHEIRAWVAAKGYTLVKGHGGASISVYNGNGQYTEFQWYDSIYWCTAKWFPITNPNNPFYKFGTNSEDREIYE